MLNLGFPNQRFALRQTEVHGLRTISREMQTINNCLLRCLMEKVEYSVVCTGVIFYSVQLRIYRRRRKPSVLSICNRLEFSSSISLRPIDRKPCGQNKLRHRHFLVCVNIICKYVTKYILCTYTEYIPVFCVHLRPEGASN